MDFTFLAEELGTIVTIILFLAFFLSSKYLDLRSDNNKLRYQIQFQAIYKEKADFLKSIYTKFYELERTLTKFSKWTITEKGQNPLSKLVTEILEDIIITRDLIEKNRIYIDDSYCDKMRNQLDKIYDALNKILDFEALNDNSLEEFKIANKSIIEEVRNQRIKLGGIFRKLIGPD